MKQNLIKWHGIEDMLIWTKIERWWKPNDFANFFFFYFFLCVFFSSFCSISERSICYENRKEKKTKKFASFTIMWNDLTMAGIELKHGKMADFIIWMRSGFMVPMLYRFLLSIITITITINITIAMDIELNELKSG